MLVGFYLWTWLVDGVIGWLAPCMIIVFVNVLLIYCVIHCLIGALFMLGCLFGKFTVWSCMCLHISAFVSDCVDVVMLCMRWLVDRWIDRLIDRFVDCVVDCTSTWFECLVVRF